MGVETTVDRTALRWRTSSFSGGDGCVDVAPEWAADGTLVAVHVRQSKDPDGPIVTLTPDGWERLITWARTPGALHLG